MKEPKCKICGGKHYKSFCFQAPKKSIVTKKPLQARRTALKPKTVTHATKPRKPLKRAALKPRSTSSPRKKLIYQLDSIFSVYIRRKDANHDIARCVTCGAKAHWRDMQNGHYISRRRLHTRWSEINCHVQCPYCNETLSGNLDKYKQYMIETYGTNEIFHLQQISTSTGKIQTSELESLISHYQSKVASLV